MIEIILFVLWFFAPAGVANVTPILVAKLPGLREWSAPMDFGFTYRGKRVFGKHKTWRGFITGVRSAAIAFPRGSDDDHCRL